MLSTRKMLIIDQVFGSIALETNPSMAVDRLKYSKEQADARAELIANAKAAAGSATNPEDRLKALLKEYELMQPSVDKDAVNRQKLLSRKR